MPPNVPVGSRPHSGHTRRTFLEILAAASGAALVAGAPALARGTPGAAPLEADAPLPPSGEREACATTTSTGASSRTSSQASPFPSRTRPL